MTYARDGTRFASRLVADDVCAGRRPRTTLLHQTEVVIEEALRVDAKRHFMRR
jgi:hypothetical protein